MRLLLLWAVLFLLPGCGGNPFWLPAAHKITIQQGNLLSEEQLAQVSVGMNREAVRGLLGSPVSEAPFHVNRWDYIYTRGPAGTAIVAKRVSIYFENERVATIDSNTDTTSGELPPQRRWWEFFSLPRS